MFKLLQKQATRPNGVNEKTNAKCDVSEDLATLGEALFRSRKDRIGQLIIVSDDHRERRQLISLLTSGAPTRTLNLADGLQIDFGILQTQQEHTLEILGISTETTFLQLLYKLNDTVVGYIIIVGGEAISKLEYLDYLIRHLRANLEAPFVTAINRASTSIGVFELLRRNLNGPLVDFNTGISESVLILLRGLIESAEAINDKGPAVQKLGGTSLRTEELVKVYKNRKVVNRVSIDVKQGEIIGLLGPNGAGKTTTFYMIAGMIRPKSGKIYLDDKDITKLPMYKRARMGIGYLSQESSIFRGLTVEQNILSILETLPISKQERKSRLEALLEELHLTGLAKSKANTLSGGERRRVEITRTLVTNPKFILLDEPFAGVDPIAAEVIQNIIQRLKYKGIGVVITDHNVHETLSITDKVYLLYDGEVLKSGTSQFLASDPEAMRLYLGENFKLF